MTGRNFWSICPRDLDGAAGAVGRSARPDGGKMVKPGKFMRAKIESNLVDWAIAPCCWGVYWPQDNRLTWEQYLKEISHSGYQYTELGPYGFAPVNSNQLIDTLARHKVGLVAASHVHPLADISGWTKLERRAHQICALLQQAGARQFILMDEAEFYSGDTLPSVSSHQWKEVLRQIALTADIVKQYKLEFAIHPHIGTCIQTESDIDRLLEDCEPGIIRLCLDTGHLAFWRSDPLTFLRRRWNHVASVHLKNIEGSILRQVHSGSISCDEAIQLGLFTDLDRGGIDMRSFLRLLLSRGFSGPIVIEQDLSAHAKRSPERIARHNLEFLNMLAEQEKTK